MRILAGYKIDILFKTKYTPYIREAYSKEFKKFETYFRNGFVYLENFNLTSTDLIAFYKAIKKFNRTLISIKKQKNIDIYYRTLQGKRIELEDFDRYLAAILKHKKLLRPSDTLDGVYYLDFHLKLYVKDKNLRTSLGEKRKNGKDIMSIWGSLKFVDLF